MKHRRFRTRANLNRRPLAQETLVYPSELYLNDLKWKESTTVLTCAVDSWWLNDEPVQVLSFLAEKKPFRRRLRQYRREYAKHNTYVCPCVVCCTGICKFMCVRVYSCVLFFFSYFHCSLSLSLSRLAVDIAQFSRIASRRDGVSCRQNLVSPMEDVCHFGRLQWAISSPVLVFCSFYVLRQWFGRNVWSLNRRCDFLAWEELSFSSRWMFIEKTSFLLSWASIGVQFCHLNPGGRFDLHVKKVTVNPEYFVCMLFSCISYAASVRKLIACLMHHNRARNWTFDENHFLVSS